MQSFFTSYKGGRIHYKIHGKGKPVVLLHGYCESSSVWEQWMEAHRAKQLFVAIDLPGFGQSTLLSAEYTIDDLTSILHQIMEGLAIKQFTIMGHSMGGYVALAYAARFPNQLNGLGLIHSHCFQDSPDRIANRRKSIDFIHRHGTGVFLKEFYGNLFAPDHVSLHIPTIRKLQEAGKHISAEAIAQGAKAMIDRPDYETILAQFKQPVFMFCGGQDTAIACYISFRMASIPQFGDFHFLPECGHMGFFEATSYFYRSVSGFLERL